MFFPIVNVLPPSPIVTVDFSGLLVVRCLNSRTCEIAVLYSPPHKFKISLEVNEPDNATRTIPIYSGTSPVTFSIAGTVASGVSAFEAPGPFSRDPLKDRGRDFRWAIDLEGDEFHREFLDVDMTKIRSTGIITSGVFYSAERTDEVSLPNITRTRGGVPHGMSSITGVIGARIDVASGSHLNLEVQEGTNAPKLISLPRDREDKPGTTYVIRISNEPPEGTTTDPDELLNYYQVLKKRVGGNILDGEKWKLAPNPPSMVVSTDEIPCMPITLNEGH